MYSVTKIVGDSDHLCSNFKEGPEPNYGKVGNADNMDLR
jgi:hypothetical protein